MIGVDWIALALLVAAVAFSRLTAASVAVKHWAFAVALFAIAGWRLRAGAQGVNLVFVLVAAGLGVSYAVQGLRARR
jgi:hypothetical protein